MKIEEHEVAYKEHLKHLNRAIEDGVGENQRNIGYNLSQGSVELLSIYLHKLRLFSDSGDKLDHRIFKSKSLTDKRIPFTFSNKKEILEIMRFIELERNTICYGKRKPEKRIEELIKKFNELRRIINKNLENKND